MQGTLITVRREIGVGEIIGGHWVVEGPLGQGGMAVVVAARHVEMGKAVAIKILTRADPDAIARFEREAMTLAKLETKRTVCIHDFGTLPSGAPYLVMDKLEGETVDERGARVVAE